MQKIATTKIMVDLPSFYLNRTAIIDSLTGIYISDKQFFSNVIMMVNHQRKQLYTLKKLSLSEEVFTWRVVASLLSVEAYSIRQFNSVVLPFSLISSFLQGSQGLPSYSSKAAFSFIVGHEIMHSMDSRGRGFDLQGRLSMIWDKASITRYGKRGDCIKKSFKSSFLTKIAYRSHLVGLSFESDNMLDEVLSDIQALNTIVRLEDRGARKQQLLPAVNFTQAQTLYMTITQSICGHMGSLAQILHTHLGEHPIYNNRINGMMMNSPQFSRVFGCPAGAKMNPVKKCGSLFGK